MFARDSPLLAVDRRREEQIVPYYTVLATFINNPGDLSDPQRMAKLYELVHELEAFPESWGPQSTNLFLNDFLSFEEQNDEIEDNELAVDTKNKTFNANDIETFLSWPEYDWWKGFLKLRKEG